ncbi:MULTISPECIES: hypothetical protein [Sphingomonas]|uniref:hypothetical protein n=1 Tax=Sphingomonas TaxID=13687 RepID=UPI000F7D740D|nr:hypothetical protein [Sphingomonas sp. ABOLF]RSV14265.1 hypothetical protein CA235_12525 [Sphingomonas sp. ABOLF]GLK21031.1 hypothetical protein GCM10017606_18570 [Microbacterium terregens]
MPTGLKALLLVVASALCWLGACRLAGVREPWDAEAYWRLWVPASLALSAVAGWFWRKPGWPAGVLITFGQLPVLWIANGESGGLWVAGVLTLGVLALPAAAVSGVAARLRRGTRR